jgi:hypothetical protein
VRHYLHPLVPHLWRSNWGSISLPSSGFPAGVPPTFACSAFVKESGMKGANANKVHRKSGSGLGYVFLPALRAWF